MNAKADREHAVGGRFCRAALAALAIGAQALATAAGQAERPPDLTLLVHEEASRYQVDSPVSVAFPGKPEFTLTTDGCGVGTIPFICEWGHVFKARPNGIYYDSRDYGCGDIRRDRLSLSVRKKPAGHKIIKARGILEARNGNVARQWGVEYKWTPIMDGRVRVERDQCRLAFRSRPRFVEIDEGGRWGRKSRDFKAEVVDPLLFHIPCAGLNRETYDLDEIIRAKNREIHSRFEEKFRTTVRREAREHGEIEFRICKLSFH